MASETAPCHKEFRIAFECFVRSEPKEEGGMKGQECVDLFKGMQGCFEKFPEFYSDQLREEEDSVEAAIEEVADEYAFLFHNLGEVPRL